MYFPIRVYICGMTFFAAFFCYMLRVNASLLIVAMVKTAKAKPGKDHDAPYECLPKTSTNQSVNITLPDYGARYDWNEVQQGQILGMYFIGYTITQILGGLMAEILGPTFTVAFSTVWCSIFTAAIPFVAPLHFGIVAFFRTLIGMGAGLQFPAFQTVMAYWAPPHEKSAFSFAFFGGSFGTMASWPFIAVLTEDMGWVWGWLIPAIISLCFAAIWWITVTDHAEDHRCISEWERDYLMENIPPRPAKKGLPPYVKIITNTSFLAFLVLQFGNTYGLYLVMTSGPKFLTEAMGYDIKKSGVHAALPYLSRSIGALVFGNIGARVLKNELVTTTQMRKIFSLFSHGCAGVCCAAIAFAGCDIKLILVLLNACYFFNGATACTSFVNAQDLAPNYAGTLFGIANFTGSMAGYISPSLTARILSAEKSMNSWRIIFGIGGGIYIFTNIVFLLFGSGEKQDFNDEE